MKRRPDESFEDYKARRAAASRESEVRNRSGWWVFKGNGQPYTRAGAEKAKAEAVQAFRTNFVCWPWIAQFLVTPAPAPSAEEPTVTP